jgi:hypothetical protein
MNYRAISSRIFSVLLIATFASIALPTSAQSQTLPARLFASDYSIHLRSGSPTWCVKAEPINNAWNPTDVNPNTLTMISVGTGSVSQVYADTSKPMIVGDSDGNGIVDITFCFRKTDLQALFSNFHGNKPKTVTVTIQGSLYTGGTFSAQLGVDVYQQ